VTLPGGWELVLILLVIMVLFGAKRLPDASRSLGRSLRIFKAETKGLRDDSDTVVTDRDGDGPPGAPAAQRPLAAAPAIGGCPARRSPRQPEGPAHP
jgi:sec-independent protein translocase protein TatA